MNIIILLFLIGIAIVYVVPTIRPKLFMLLSWKKALLLTGLYLGVLIMLVPLFYMLPDIYFHKIVENKAQAIATSQNLMNDLYNHHIPTEGDLAKLEGIYKNSSHTFKIDSNKLSFNLQPNTGSYHVFIERKDVDDGEIDLSTYTTAQYMGEVNFTKRLIPPEITLKNGMLSLGAYNRQTLEFKQFNADFTADQFNNQTSSIHEMSTNFGNQIVYLRVPKSLEINRGVLEDRILMINSN